MRRISIHILDLVSGKPASGVPARLEGQTDGDWKILNSEITDQDGRCAQLLQDGEEMPGAVYRLTFDTGSYYSQKQINTMYPVVEVKFRARDGE